MLLAAQTIGNTYDYDGWRREHLTTEQHLEERGLLRSLDAELHPDVAFSLARHE